MGGSYQKYKEIFDRNFGIGDNYNSSVQLAYEIEYVEDADITEKKESTHCEYCLSRLFQSDRNCPQCGATIP